LYWRFNFTPGKPPIYKIAIRAGDWKIVNIWERTNDGGNTASVPKLISLPKDVAEAHDLSKEEAARFAALQQKWDAWNAELAVPFKGELRAKDLAPEKAWKPRKAKGAEPNP
jgi:hypothetical protein